MFCFVVSQNNIYELISNSFIIIVNIKKLKKLANHFEKKTLKIIIYFFTWWLHHSHYTQTCLENDFLLWIQQEISMNSSYVF